jgi:hypothetical protein
VPEPGRFHGAPVDVTGALAAALAAAVNIELPRVLALSLYHAVDWSTHHHSQDNYSLPLDHPSHPGDWRTHTSLWHPCFDPSKARRAAAQRGCKTPARCIGGASGARAIYHPPASVRARARTLARPEPALHRNTQDH